GDKNSKQKKNEAQTNSPPDEFIAGDIVADKTGAPVTHVEYMPLAGECQREERNRDSLFILQVHLIKRQEKCTQNEDCDQDSVCRNDSPMTFGDDGFLWVPRREIHDRGIALS